MKKLLAFLLIALVASAHVEEVASQVDEYEEPNLQFFGFLIPILKVVGGLLVKKLELGKVAAVVGKAFAFGKKVFTGVKHFVQPLIKGGKALIGKFKGTRLVKNAHKIYNRITSSKLYKTGKALYDKYKPYYDKIKSGVEKFKEIKETIEERKQMEQLQKQYEEMERKYEQDLKREEEAIRREEQALGIKH